MSKLEKMIAYLHARDADIAKDIIETLIAARVMRESFSVVRIVGKSIVEIRNEEQFISAAKDFSDLTDVWSCALPGLDAEETKAD